MKTVRKLLTENYKHHKHLDYYEKIIDEIEDNLLSNPDISIECCKSLIEGLSKTMLKALDNTTTDRELNKLEVMPLFKSLLNKLSEYNCDIETEFKTKATSIILSIATIRTARGDISHGKIAPKNLNSSLQFAVLVSKITEALVFYILEQFFAIDFSFKQPLVYEDNPEFNKRLDELNPIGSLSYSKALFEQEQITYSEELAEYISNKEIDN